MENYIKKKKKKKQMYNKKGCKRLKGIFLLEEYEKNTIHYKEIKRKRKRKMKKSENV